MDKGWGPPQPFTTCKGTRAAPPPTLHDLQMDKSWGPCKFSRLGSGLQMDKGWGRLPNGQGLGASPTPICKWTRVGLHDSPTPDPTCKWTRVGGRNPSRPTNGQGLGAPQPFTTCKWTTVGQGLGPPEFPPLTSTAVGQGLDPLNLSRFGVAPQINFTASTYVSKPTRRLVRRSTKQ